MKVCLVSPLNWTPPPLPALRDPSRDASHFDFVALDDTGESETRFVDLIARLLRRDDDERDLIAGDFPFHDGHALIIAVEFAAELGRPE